MGHHIHQIGVNKFKRQRSLSPDVIATHGGLARPGHPTSTVPEKGRHLHSIGINKSKTHRSANRTRTVIHIPPAPRARSTRRFQVPDLYRRSPESGKFRYTTRRLKKTICSPIWGLVARTRHRLGVPRHSVDSEGFFESRGVGGTTHTTEYGFRGIQLNSAEFKEIRGI